ncbi:MAG TPA: 3-hydroxyacyl-CoA dehydrogenase NAD-binding domain-containing protein, partial [Jatrophihabitans sp.]|nr:3-hydroxyacyl-CoA dehydrogenase NAD-binding domain-containing protein [Jatrophihabitans sp.]
MARRFNRVGVVGLGTMGAGIAEVFARNGLSVVAVDRDQAAVARGRGHIEHSTGRA